METVSSFEAGHITSQAAVSTILRTRVDEIVTPEHCLCFPECGEQLGRHFRIRPVVLDQLREALDRIVHAVFLRITERLLTQRPEHIEKQRALSGLFMGEQVELERLRTTAQRFQHIGQHVVRIRENTQEEAPAPGAAPPVVVIAADVGNQGGNQQAVWRLALCE